ncbi:GNAT family N-acetyltransferase [Vibrio vulnificus]|nr:GNAT family N-acetyltransferase [Vibrio vulnificus]EJX1092025.1 GNAT family N-acetyltransferase [Vibrio vulnificus]ELH3491761.1 GNAT family N-acetyltransferase [Vibrio vulnificus]ELK2034104.1 GNAT family N-acetyltransferase [Vibrio vulnificus]ELK2279883.1 GNAT family N-acetyltransferase [Vibrio vulnificus]
MFTLDATEEIKLALVQDTFAKLYAPLVAKQQTYLSQWLAWPSFCQTEQDFQQFVQRSLHEYADKKSVTCAIFYQDNLVGNIGLHEINHDLQRACIGYWLSEELQGKGIVTLSCQKMLEYAFDTLSMELVQLRAAKENTASRAVAERLGMSLEGIISRNEKVQDRVLDHAVYALRKTDWQEKYSEK